MCLIIKKPSGRRITADFLEHAWKHNSHGWGSFHVDEGKVVWARGLKLSELIAHNAQLPLDTEVFLHVRKATRGHVNEEMAHPFFVRDGLMLMHNGTITHLAPQDVAVSDTSELARLLRNMLEGLDEAQAAALIRTQGFLRLTAPLIHGSMVVLMDKQGAVKLGRAWHTVQQHEWDGTMPGIDVSNTHAWVPKSKRHRFPPWRQVAQTLLGGRRRSAA